VFLAPTGVRMLEIAPMKLRFNGPGGERFVRVEAWPLNVAPLVPEEASPREGLGELRPDTAPPLIDTSARRTRLRVCACALLLLTLLAAWHWFGLPWLGRRQRPFNLAWRALRRLPAQPSDGQRQAAFKALHAALNGCAGEVLFEAGLPRFVDRHPGFAPLQDDLVQFFRHSHDEFFAGRSSAADCTWLRRLGQACRDAERNGA
jgi:mxaA protein